MSGIPRTLPNDSEDVVWALETAESLWKRGERVDAVVWLRRAAQAAGETDDTRRAASLAKSAAELGDWIASNTVGTEGAQSSSPRRTSASAEDLDALLEAPAREGSDVFILSGNDVEIVSAGDFEAGLEPPKQPATSDSEIMTVSIHAPDVEILEDAESQVEEFPEEEPTPVVKAMRSPVPHAASPAPSVVPSAAEAHAGMLDPWAEREPDPQKAATKAPRAPSRKFDEDEVVTSAARAQPEADEDAPAVLPPAPRAPTFPSPRGRPRPTAPSGPTAPERPEAETTTYRQIHARTDPRSEPSEESPQPSPAATRAKPAPPSPPPARPSGKLPPPKAPPPKPAAPVTKPAPMPVEEPPPANDLLAMVDAVVTAPPPSTAPLAEPKPSAAPTPRPPRVSVPASARPTAPPPGSMPTGAMPSAPPTRPRAGSTLLDLEAVEALGDLPEDAREAFGLAATIHTIAVEEEVSHFALALVVEGTIDVASTIVEAPAMRLERNAVLRSRGTLVPGVALRLLGASEKSIVATWDDAAVAEAFRTSPWVEEDLHAVADRVQARVGLTMGPLGERFDLSLREHLTSKLTLRTLAPGEVLVAEGSPVGVLIVGVGEIAIKKKSGERAGTMRPGDFVFPSQTLAHGKAPDAAIAGDAGAIVFVGDRATAQELLMTFPPLLELLATL